MKFHSCWTTSIKVNEGTIFSESIEGLNLTGAAQDEAFISFIGHLVIDNSTITPDVYNDILTMWPANDPLLGAPFNTGDSLFDRGEAWYTDEMFLAPRRLFFENAAPLQPMFAYYFREFIPGQNPTLGGDFFHYYDTKSAHSDLPFILQSSMPQNFFYSLVQCQRQLKILLPIRCLISTSTSSMTWILEVSLYVNLSKSKLEFLYPQLPGQGTLQLIQRMSCNCCATT